MGRTVRKPRRPGTRLAGEKARHMRPRRPGSNAQYADPQTGRMVTVSIVRQTQTGRYTISVRGKLRSVTPGSLR